MKTTMLVLLFILSVFTVSAQLVVTPGSQFSVSGNTKLTLENTDLVNNGMFIAGNGITSFSGNISSTISGSEPIDFFEMEMNKGNGSAVILQTPISIVSRVLFISGFLNLNGFNADLGTTGHLDGEQENTHVIGPNGGELTFNVNLDFPTFFNPANLGVFITANQNLGNVIIKRGHRSQVNNLGTGNSIFRYYDILPDNNVNLDATLRMKYFDTELNGLNETAIGFFKSEDHLNWTSLGSNSRDVATNFAEKNSISSFGRFTLSSNNNPLSIDFILLNAGCVQNHVLVTWKTAQEHNSSHFNIERSDNDIQWTSIGSLPAAGNSNTESTYSFTDSVPIQNGSYRIAAYDLDGNLQFSSSVLASCGINDIITVGPNPVHDVSGINIVTGNVSQARIKLFDDKGALIKNESVALLPGNNQIRLDMKMLPAGSYFLIVHWKNGQNKRTIKLIKQ